MRVTLSENGELRIVPDSPVEAWALRSWLEHYGKGKKGSRTSLTVETVVNTGTLTISSYPPSGTTYIYPSRSSYIPCGTTTA